MKTIYLIRTCLLSVACILALSSCTVLDIVMPTQTYDMTILEFSNQRLENGVTFIDAKVINRGCSPQSFVKAELEKSGNNFEIAILYKDDEGASTCATFEERHAVSLGQLASGSYSVKARAQTEPSITITIP